MMLPDIELGLCDPLVSPDANGWLPIGSAPANEFQGNVLVIGGAWPEPTIVKNDGDWWRYRQAESSKGIPTHWQPLPKPPVQTTPPRNAS